MNFNSGKFWSLQKDYYSESANAGAGKYNTYEEFISGSKVDSTLKNYEYKTPFDFTPSYGSSARISFNNELIEYGNGYLFLNPAMLNNIIISFDLNFNSRDDEQSDKIVEYIKSKDGHKEFPFQPKPKQDFQQTDSYKSLYSLFPYFIQEFFCGSISLENDYIDSSSISLKFVNQNFSIINVRNILEVESMPSAQKTIIEEYKNKYTLDIQPSYSMSREIDISTDVFNGAQSRLSSIKDSINNTKEGLSLKFNNINDTKLLKLLSFFINKIGSETFSFSLKKPEEKTAEFVCESINHTYLYKGSHNLEVSIMESPTRRRLNKGVC